MERRKALQTEEPSAGPSKDRWYTDPGSIPGEPQEYLDVQGDDLEGAKAVIIEHETPKGPRFEARTGDGKSLGTFEFAEQARKAAENSVATLGGTPEVKKIAPGVTGREPGKQPGITRDTKMARNAKAAERAAKNRQLKGVAGAGGGGKELTGGGAGSKAIEMREAEEAQRRATSPDYNLDAMQIPQLEEALQKFSPPAFSGLQKFRKLKNLSEAEYKAALVQLNIRALETRGLKPPN
jgi:hypothetical protein